MMMITNDLRKSWPSIEVGKEKKSLYMIYVFRFIAQYSASWHMTYDTLGDM